MSTNIEQLTSTAEAVNTLNQLYAELLANPNVQHRDVELRWSMSEMKLTYKYNTIATVRQEFFNKHTAKLTIERRHIATIPARGNVNRSGISIAAMQADMSPPTDAGSALLGAVVIGSLLDALLSSR
jgi:hypothetical protein